jgi:hypothetical protein
LACSRICVPTCRRAQIAIAEALVQRETRSRRLQRACICSLDGRHRSAPVSSMPKPVRVRARSAWSRRRRCRNRHPIDSRDTARRLSVFAGEVNLDRVSRQCGQRLRELSDWKPVGLLALRRRPCARTQARRTHRIRDRRARASSRGAPRQLVTAVLQPFADRWIPVRHPDSPATNAGPLICRFQLLTVRPEHRGIFVDDCVAIDWFGHDGTIAASSPSRSTKEPPGERSPSRR